MMKIVTPNGSDTYDEANKVMLNEYLENATPDGEICFLTTDPKMQGKGIGSLLLEELGRREKGKQIYLYTDDNCTYQFYEHKGFERLKEKEIKMEIGGKNVPLTCLLYSKQL
ncbi:GNAT family N-acetyltransferase [Lacrimispora xylanisolvens]|uniref:GNAT family N-acetyltransferase n=1 Tax=Lacrimispora xylanisolvens TaxID=384636 RepID=UPI002402CD90